jgi:pyrroloquinoline-quinone synthase
MPLQSRRGFAAQAASSANLKPGIYQTASRPSRRIVLVSSDGEGSEVNLIERIDEARARWNVLDHPFYLRWERGDLTREDLAFYAGEYRHAVVALADAAAAGGDAEHAAEEAAHIQLWDDFAAALDAPLGREPNPETRECADSWRAEDSLAARAVLYAIESSQPDVSRTKLTGLVDHFGFAAGSKGTEYFDLHAERDHEHAAASAEVLSKAAPEDADRLVAAAEGALQGNWQLLDGVEARV